ncbi:MAG: hypothetical protein LBU51_11080 [Bacteroidales bacterium]|nr:hypothetical protein [Bacteroidales bacterium]
MVLVTILLLSGCKKDPVIYNFRSNEEDKLLNHYTIGKVITLQNELSEVKQFEINSITEKVRLRLDWIFVGMGGSDMYYFYYDSKTGINGN